MEADTITLITGTIFTIAITILTMYWGWKASRVYDLNRLILEELQKQTGKMKKDDSEVNDDEKE
jgi:hypothetical protein